MLKAVRKHFFSRGYVIFEDEIPTAYMRSYPNPRRKVAGDLQVGGDLYEVVRDMDDLNPVYLLRRYEKRSDIAIATHRPWVFGPWSGSLLLEYGGRSYTGKNPAGGSFTIHEENSDRKLGSVDSSGMFSLEISGNLPEEWPLEMQVFTLLLADFMRRWNPQAGAGSSGG